MNTNNQFLSESTRNVIQEEIDTGDIDGKTSFSDMVVTFGEKLSQKVKERLERNPDVGPVYSGQSFDLDKGVNENPTMRYDFDLMGSDSMYLKYGVKVIDEDGDQTGKQDKFNKSKPINIIAKLLAEEIVAFANQLDG